VEKGSRAERAGFRAGDVIVRINGSPISDAGDFTHALHGREQNSVSITILRDRKEQTLTLSLPERKQGEVEESLGPEIGAEVHKQMSQVRAELAQIQPQLAIYDREVARQTRKAAEKVQKQHHELEIQMEQMRRSLRDQQEQLRRELREWGRRAAEI
jgi:membrane-associated protease RseP (regulator of RpoE activity)